LSIVSGQHAIYPSPNRKRVRVTGAGCGIVGRSLAHGPRTIFFGFGYAPLIASHEYFADQRSALA
jgi:hypothetical protein